jgi:iron only hydrogenase large subunit-like protein
MPCYDKKLEASRKEFFSEANDSKDVDCVLSTIEIEQFLLKEHLDLSLMPEDDLHLPVVAKNEENGQLEKCTDLYYHNGGGSGGYAEAVLINAAKELFGYELARDKIVYKQLKNADFKEMCFEIDGEVKLRFAIAYGFRNIQNIVQKIKKNNCAYHYVEVMACPSGCNNGGGQIRDETTNTLSKTLLERVENLYHSVKSQTPEENLFVKDLYQVDWLKHETDSVKRNLHTSYHVIEKTTNGLAIKW